MNIVDLHPEDLIDKLVRGELSESEAVRLQAHLDGCAVCRFECAARASFDDPSSVSEERERSSQSVRHSVQSRAALVAGQQADAGSEKRQRRSMWAATVHNVTSKGRWIRSQTPAFLAAALLTLTGGAIGAIWSHRVFSKDRPLANLEIPAFGSIGAPHSSRPSVRAGGPGTPPAASECPPAASAESVAFPAPDPLLEALPVVRHHDPFGTDRARTSRRAPALGPGGDPAVHHGEAVPSEVTPQALFATGNNARRNGDLTLAMRLYRELQEKYPASGEARLSHATMGRLLLDRGDAGAALREFERYSSDGGGILDEEALAGRALAFRALGRGDEEAETWIRVLSKYPHSAYARQAKARLAGSGRP